MKISIIVPIYNIANFIEKCVKSILSQTYTNLEIILVNDGSTDSSSELCQKLKLSDPRVIVVSKTNGGLASARNYGLKYATGEFVGFIDGDDWIEPDFYEILLDGILNHDADISVVQFDNCYDFNNIEYTTETFRNWEIYGKELALQEYYRGNHIKNSAANKLYKMELFKDILYPEGKLMEDMATTYKLIDKSNKIVVNSSKKYHYFIRPNSIMQSNFNIKNFDSLDIFDEIFEYFNNSSLKLNHYIRGRYTYEVTRLLFKMLKSKHGNFEDYSRCKQLLLENKKYIFACDKLKRKVQILSVVLMLLPTKSLIFLGRFFNKFLNKVEVL